MYQKILNEAIRELKEEEFKGVFTGEQKIEDLVSDCQLETDLELLIPDHYVASINERLNLYKELDSIETEEGLDEFTRMLKDRFGPLPEETKNLVQSVKLRRLAQKAGFEKLSLKFGRMTGTFTGKQDSVYFQTEAFGKVLQFIQQHPAVCEMKEKNDKLTLRFEKVRTVKKAIALLEKLV